MLGGVIMFCNCTSLEECEKILMSKLDGIDFIGQYSYSMRILKL